MRKSTEARFERSLKAALTKHQLVRVTRSRIEDGYMDGRVVAVGGELVVLNLVSDDLVMNGYIALRLADITSVKAPAPHAAFIEKVLVARSQRDAPLALAQPISWWSILETAAVGWPLVAIHKEDEESGTILIGQIIGSTSSEAVSLRLLSADGRWKGSRAQRVALNDVSRIDFGGLYEEALAIGVGLIKRPRRRLPATKRVR
jgi:hypothetical protein